MRGGTLEQQYIVLLHDEQLILTTEGWTRGSASSRHVTGGEPRELGREGGKLYQVGLAGTEDQDGQEHGGWIRTIWGRLEVGCVEDLDVWMVIKTDGGRL